MANTKSPPWALELIEEVRRQRGWELELMGGHPRMPAVPGEIRNLTRLRSLSIFDQRIRVLPEWIAKLTDLRFLEVSGNQLTTLPRSMARLTELRSLSIGRNQLEEVPGVIRELTKLEELDLSGCQLATVPDWIGELTQLRHLHLNANQLTAVPATIGRLSSLETLDLSDNSLRAVPPAVRELRHLRTLSLAEVGLAELPPWIGELTALTFLRVGDNDLTELPSSVRDLGALRTLSVPGNPFDAVPPEIRSLTRLELLDISSTGASELPSWIGELEALEILSLVGNRVVDLPPSIATLSHLIELDILGNPLESPPSELAMQGIGAIRAYFEQLEEQGASRLYEAKLLIVGEPGAGKTSLAAKLVDPDADLPAPEETTRGIDVVPWRFRTPEGKDVTVSIWDFGGQQIYHATHQFFLTHRSAYALVCDERKEDTDFDYWLDVTRRLGGGSPLVIANNVVHGRIRALNGAGYRKAYGHLHDILAVDLLTGVGLAEVADALRKAVLGLDHIGVTLPAGWLRIRRTLTDRREAGSDHIAWGEFATICEEAGLDDRAQQRQVAQYLHDLGVCLHFQDDDQLSKTVILNPTWGTDAVYRVLDDEATATRWGEFGPDDLARLWHEDRYADMWFDLLRLMQRFRLCYQIPDTETYLAPQLLSPEPPEYDWDPTGAAFIRYEYDFMPKGMLTQLIVRLHHLIRDGTTMWRNGVVLDRGDDTAEVIESYRARRIDIRVKGPNARGLTAIVMDTIDRINQVFDGTGARIRIPCVCSECAASEEPHLHDADELRRLRPKTATRQCVASAEDVSIDRLLDAIGPAERLPSYFVSYKRPGPTEPDGESAAVVDELQAVLAASGRRLLRDDEVIGYGESIGAFMDRLGAGDAVVVVLSDAYLRSANAMSELLRISQRRGFARLIRLIVMPDAHGIYDAVGRAGYLAFWDEKVEQLRRLGEARPQRGFDLQDDLSLHEGIRNAIHEVLPVLADQNARDLEWHRANGHADIIALLPAHAPPSRDL